MFNKIKISTRLLMGFGLVLVLMGLIAISGYSGINSISDTATTLLEREGKLVRYAEEIRSLNLSLRRFEKDYFLNIGTADKEAEYYNKWKDKEKQLGETLVKVEAYLVEQQDKDAVKTIKTQFETYREGFEVCTRAIKEGRAKTPQEANTLMAQYKEAIRSMEKEAEELADKAEVRMNKSQEIMLSYAQSTRRTMLIIAIVALLAGIGASLLLANTITTPVRNIVALFSDIGMGNFAARATVIGTDELAQMTQALNAMLDNTLSLIQSSDERDRIQQNISKLLEEISEVAEGDLTKEAEVTAEVTGAIADSFNFMILELRRIIGQVQETTLQVTVAANEVQTTAEHLSQGSEHQATQIVDTSSAVEEMATSIQQVSENAILSANVAEEARKNAKQGTEIVQKTISGMAGIRQQVQETSKRIKRLGESSQEIGEIVQLISDIADRTSILALNASIQAAMAGESGRGFAVVAGEVERLAVRSAEATKRIATLIKSIQSETNEAVSAMEATTREVVQGSDLANQAGQTLTGIESVSNQLAELIQSISLASRQQARGSESIAKSMGEISDVTQQTAAGTKQAAVSIRNLAYLADNLRDSVSRFRLPSNGNGHHGSQRVIK